MSKEKWENITLELPVEYIKDEKFHIIKTNKKSEDIFEQFFIVQGDSFEEAEREFWQMVKFNSNFHKVRSGELNKWKLFQKGPWGQIGGNWFTILGINIFFRYGKNMKGGWYVPLTKFNISVHNYWFKPKKQNHE